ncbi:MAG: hypothetical protein U0Q12_01055 [Vicinamibacterales bacterium]
MRARPDFARRSSISRERSISALQQGGRLQTTSAKHLEGAPLESAQTREADGFPSRRDGNNVQIDHELLMMTQAQGEFSRAQTALAAKFRLVKYAINEAK